MANYCGYCGENTVYTDGTSKGYCRLCGSGPLCIDCGLLYDVCTCENTDTCPECGWDLSGGTCVNSDCIESPYYEGGGGNENTDTCPECHGTLVDGVCVNVDCSECPDFEGGSSEGPYWCENCGNNEVDNPGDTCGCVYCENCGWGDHTTDECTAVSDPCPECGNPDNDCGICDVCGKYNCQCEYNGNHPTTIEITYDQIDGLGQGSEVVTVNSGESFTLLNIDSFTADVPVTITYKDGDTIYKTIEYDVSNRFTLIEWEDENGDVYDPGESVTFYEDTRLVAHFNQASEGREIEPASPPTKNGYIFNGWSHTNNSASGFTDTVDIYEDETLYATWKYRVSYNANGGTGAPSAQEKTHNTSLTLSSTKPNRSSTSAGSYTITLDANGGFCSEASVSAARTTNYSFSKWKATDGTSYSSGGTYTANAPTTMSAQWTSSTSTESVTLPSASRLPGFNSRTVTLDYNDGTGIKTTIESKATVTHTHNGWYTAASGGTKRNNSYTPSKSETLYAQYTSSTGPYSAVALPTPTRDNHAFKGWATSSSATTGVTGSYTPTGNVTLYAIWEEAATYTVTYNANGGTYAPDPQTTYIGESITIPSTIPTKEVSGTYTITYDANGGDVTPNKKSVSFTTEYAFCDWNTEKEGYGDPYDPGNTYSFETDITLYAYFEEVYTDVDPVTLPTPTRDGYNFLGWADSPDAGSGSTGTYFPYSNITLYAIWSQPITYQIKYNANGGVGTMENSTHTYGVSSNLSENKFTKSGYEFIGWATTSTGIVKFTDKQVINNLSTIDNAVINLYAVWKSLAVIDVKVAGKYKDGVPYVRIGNSWKKGIGAYVKVGGSWKSSS